MLLVGRTLDGCFGEYTTLPEINARKIPSSIPPERAALLEPLGVAVHALEAVEPSGKRVAILGCGAIGLLAIGATKALGALTVFATSRSPGKLERARQMGADLALSAVEDDVVGEILKATGGLGVDAVIELSGSEEAFHQGFQIMRNRGTMVLVGLPPEPVSLDIPGEMIRKEARLVGSFGRRMWQTWITAERLLERDLVDVSLATGKTFPLAEYRAAFQEAASPAPGRVLLIP
jgi:threonine 3-dehydrogenase